MGEKEPFFLSWVKYNFTQDSKIERDDAITVNHSTMQFLYNYDVLSFTVKRIRRVHRLYLKGHGTETDFQLSPLYTTITAFAILASNSMRYS